MSDPTVDPPVVQLPIIVVENPGDDPFSLIIGVTGPATDAEFVMDIPGRSLGFIGARIRFGEDTPRVDIDKRSVRPGR